MSATARKRRRQARRRSHPLAAARRRRKPPRTKKSEPPRDSAAETLKRRLLRLALDVHDGPMQNLAVIGFSLGDLRRRVNSVVPRGAPGQDRPGDGADQRRSSSAWRPSCAR